MQNYLKDVIRNVSRLTPTDTSLQEVRLTLARQALKPPGGDLCIGACYHASLLLLGNLDKKRQTPPETTRNLEKLILGVLKKRGISPEYFVNLYFRCLQFMQMSPEVLNKTDYPKSEIYSHPNYWYDTLVTILNDRTLLTTLTSLLNDRDTTTTQYQRYLGPWSVLKTLFPGKHIRIADFGCSIMEGLKGYLHQRNFQDVNDKTQSQLVKNTLISHENDPVIDEAFGFDKYVPDDPDTIFWQYICLYPKEITAADNYINWKQSQISESPSNLHFIKTDLIVPFTQETISNVRTNDQGLEAILLITVLYQLNESYQKIVLENAKKLLKKEGVIIVQDFARKHPFDKTKLKTRGIDWTGRNHAYRLFIASEQTEWKFFEVLCWDNGRCQAVRESHPETFDNFLKQYNR